MEKVGTLSKTPAYLSKLRLALFILHVPTVPLDPPMLEIPSDLSHRREKDFRRIYELRCIQSVALKMIAFCKD